MTELVGRKGSVFRSPRSRGWARALRRTPRSIGWFALVWGFAMSTWLGDWSLARAQQTTCCHPCHSDFEQDFDRSRLQRKSADGPRPGRE